ncbi:MAG: hypothetical protein ABIK28_03030 [Planctomycetota bacterium]
MIGIVLFISFLFPGDDFSDGMGAYSAGRYEEAFEAFTAAQEKAGDQASAELLYNRALAALRMNKPLEAEMCVEKAAARGGPEFTALRDFIKGNTAFARGEAAARVACQPEAEPFAFDVALSYVMKAEAFWKQAAASRPDWPEARRNVERAQLKLIELRKQKKEKQKNPRSHGQPEIRPQLLPQANSLTDQGETREEEAQIEKQTQELTSLQIKNLFDKLEEKEREKRIMRRARQDNQKNRAEKDW